MSFPTVEEIKRTEDLSRDETLEVYEDALAFNETLAEFARCDEERHALAATMRELRGAINQITLASGQARFAVPHRTLVVAFGHAPHRVETHVPAASE